MQVYSNRIQVVFMSNNILEYFTRYLITLPGARICVDLSLLDLTLLMFLPSWEKRTVFHRSLQAENCFGQILFKSEVCKRFAILFHHMSASPVSNSVMVSPVEGSTLPSVFYSDFKLNSSL